MRKTPATYAKELHAVLKSTGREMRPEVIRTFLDELARMRKSGLKHRIFTEFCRVALATEGRRMGTVITAHALDAATRAHLGKKHPDVVFEEKTDATLVGGAIVEVEDTRFDGSVSTNLKNLKNILVKNNK